MDNGELSHLSERAFNGLTNLPFLTFSGSNLSEKLNQMIFADLKMVETLNMDKFRIEKLESEDLFAKMKNLKNLALYLNTLTFINDTIFKNLYNVVSLRLSSSKIENIDANAFEHLYLLQNLELDDNNLTRLEAVTFRNLKKLTKLELQDNKLKVIEAKLFENLTKLEELNLRTNQLETIEAFAFQNCHHLSIISLQDNKIQRLDDKFTFIGLDSIKNLNLLDNPIKSIHPEIFKYIFNKTTNINISCSYLESEELRMLGVRHLFPDKSL